MCNGIEQPDKGEKFDAVYHLIAEMIRMARCSLANARLFVHAQVVAEGFCPKGSVDSLS